ncbi:hypothetical protein CRG98_002420 [Punica granatum]|uniref:F-box domain-containing protein n=1 Tax=Punica granatum TaxID=22663 RepID=A0A2I0L976_PUNGR|nr:hypothetical protein CRG98_002420 [Punica granatum]
MSCPLFIFSLLLAIKKFQSFQFDSIKLIIDSEKSIMDSSSRAIPFTEFLEDVQLCILSFLSLPEIAAFACNSKRSLSLFNGRPSPA